MTLDLEAELRALVPTIFKANCGHTVWLSPKSTRAGPRAARRRIVTGDSYTLCMDCAEEWEPPLMEGAEKYAVPDAIERHDGVASADQARSWMKNQGVVEL